MTNNLQDRFRESVKAIIQKDIVGEVWYQDRVCDERLKRCLENAEKSFNYLFLSEVEQAKREAYEEGKAYKFNLNKKSYRLDLINQLLSEVKKEPYPNTTEGEIYRGCIIDIMENIIRK